jgi:serine/threonine protein kinase
VMGSPYYMSPEQLRASKDVDQRSDIWSLGAILYEMLTGRVPFEADTLMGLCAQVLESKPPAIQSIRPEVPAEIVRVVEGCMQKDRDQRFRTVAQVMQSFEPTMAVPGPNGTGSFQALTSPRMGELPVAAPSAQGINGGTSTSWNRTGDSELSSARKKQLIIGGVIGASALVLFGVVIANVLHHDKDPVKGENVGLNGSASAPVSTSSAPPLPTLGGTVSTTSASATPSATSTTTVASKPKPDAGVTTVTTKPTTTTITTTTTTSKPKPKPDDDLPGRR